MTNIEKQIVKLEVELDELKKVYKKELQIQEEEKFPKKWEDIKHLKGFYIDENSHILPADLPDFDSCDVNVLPTKELAEEMKSFFKLIYLRDIYRQGWKPDYKTVTTKYCIIYSFNDIIISTTTINDHVFLTFPTKEIRDLFLKNHKELIKAAKEYIN